jgi:aldehyde dehydrogenase (NAD+)
MERSLFLTLSFEVGALMIDLDYQLAHIHEWTAPEAVDTPMIIGPGNSYILHEPLGVALIMGAWNFSAYTCLRPLMGAITAGNVAIIKPSEMSPASSAVV